MTPTLAPDRYDVLVNGTPLTWRDAVRLARDRSPVEFYEAKGMPWAVAGPLTKWLRERRIAYELKVSD